jgi:hypothetical protein
MLIKMKMYKVSYELINCGFRLSIADESMVICCKMEKIHVVLVYPPPDHHLLLDSDIY